MKRHKLLSPPILLFALLLTGCDPAEIKNQVVGGFKNYEPGGFGSIDGGAVGSASSLVSISGRVMSTATFNSFSSSSMGLMAKSLSQSMLGLSLERNILAVGPSTDPCDGASWSLKYVGGGNTIISSGTASGGSFEVPQIPSGKEGILFFSCSGGVTQKCLVKAGDSDISCNSIADGVVGALEATLGQDLTQNEFANKKVAKIATAIVESTNSDSDEAETLKSAITNCKTLTNPNQKKECFKNSMLSSSQAATFEVAKTLAKNWDVRSFYNLMIGTMGKEISVDYFILYSDLGQMIGGWLNSDFITQTKSYVEELVQYPDYIQGDPSKGEQTVKIVCKTEQTKTGMGGQIKYIPKIVGGKPSCANLEALEEITGIISGHPDHFKLEGYVAQVLGGAEEGSHQIGSPDCDINNDSDCSDPGENNFSDPNQFCENSNGNNPWQIPGNFCLRYPRMSMESRIMEPDRNDIGGDYSSRRPSNNENISLVSVSPLVEGVVDSLVSQSNSFPPTDPLYHCFQMNGGGTPIINTTQTCRDWVTLHMSQYKEEFSGLIGAYLFLTRPQEYQLSSNKLSLNDIHKVFTKSTLMNSKITTDYSSGYVGVKFPISPDRQRYLNPIVNTQNLNHLFIFNEFKWDPNVSQPQITPTQALDFSDQASLENWFEVTFSPFMNIPSISQIQSFVQYSSHHQPWNPLGAKLHDIPGMKPYRNITGHPDQNTVFPIYCRMLNRTVLSSSAPQRPYIPLIKELNKSTFIECLQDPAPASITDPTLKVRADLLKEGKFDVPTSFAYPFVLQQRGFQGENKGQLFNLIDRVTGQPKRIGNSEILILEASTGNSTVTKDGTSCLPAQVGGSVEPPFSTDAPVVKVQFTYGSDLNAKSELMTAYCMDLSPYLQNDNNTMTYPGGGIDVSNGEYTFKMPLVGGKLAGQTTPVYNPVCLFASSALTFNYSNTTMRYATTAGGSLVATSQTSNCYGGACDQFITAIMDQGSSIDFCTTNLSGTTKYYLSPAWGQTTLNVTDNSPAAVGGTGRNSFPMQLIRASDNTVINGLTIALGAVEGFYNTQKSPSTLFVANTAARSWFHNIKLLNQKHNPKFDPFCDDVNGNGFCDCISPGESNLKSPASSCNLADDAAEPTISQAPYWKGQDGSDKYLDFFRNYGGKSGAELVYTDPITSMPKGLDWNYFNQNQISMRMEDIVFCKFKANTDDNVKKPTQIIYNNLSSLHFPGCPAIDGGPNNVSITWSGNEPVTGGGPIRIIKPVPMKNAYDISHPRKFMTLMNFATKTVGNGVTLDPTKKLFTFEEAIALIEIRKMLAPEIDTIYDGPLGSAEPLPGINLYFAPAQINEEDVDVVSGVFFGLTKPTMLTGP